MSDNPDFDVMCDPNNPRKVPFEDVSAAAYRIKSGVTKTPCMVCHMSQEYNMKIYLKCEFMQYTGSFKERGARNSLLQLSEEQKKNGVIAASLGNHSQGMSYHGSDLKIPTTVVMPVVAPLMKVQKCRNYGANVVVFGNNMAEAKHQAMLMAKEKKYTYINGYDHPAIIAGQGTVGLEILEQLPDVDAVLVPCGGGGLLAGICIAIKQLKPSCLVYGVETDQCASMATALKEGKPVPVDISRTLADGLAVSVVGVNSFVNIKDKVDKMVTVTEDWTARSILRMVELEKFVLEGGGAVSNAAIMSGLVPELVGKNVVCVLSGGNIDTTMLRTCLDRGLAAEQRLVKFKVNIPDKPGGIGELCTLLGNQGVNIKEITQERAWLKETMYTVRVKIVCETHGKEHTEELQKIVSSTYKDCFFLRRNSTDAYRPSLTDSLIHVNIPDKPGGIGELCTLLGNKGVNIKEFTQERAWLKETMYTVRVKIVCETHGKEHTKELQNIISSTYKDCYFLRRNSTDAYRLSLTDSLIHVNDMKTKKDNK